MTARIISYLTHPLLIPTVAAIILLRSINWMGMIPNDTRIYIYLIFTITTLLVPLLAMPLYKSTGIISDFSMPKAEERKIPFLLSSFLYLVGAYLLQQVKAPLIFPLYLNASSVVLLICALISWKWKISSHMASIAGLTGLIMGISFKWMFDLRLLLAVLILIIGLSGWSRLQSEEHTPAQVYAGFGLGFSVVFLIVRFI